VRAWPLADIERVFEFDKLLRSEGRIVSAAIFISYSSKDQDIAGTICQALEARGHQCWISSRDIRPGDNFQEAIVRALRSARIMLLVFTSNANNSDEIKKELVLAGRHRVTVVPIRVEDVVPSDAFTYELATRQWVDLFKDWEREIEILATRLGQILQTAKAHDADATAAATIAIPLQRAGVGRQSRRGTVAALALVVVALATAGAVYYLRPLSRVPSAETLPSPPAAAATGVADAIAPARPSASKAESPPEDSHAPAPAATAAGAASPAPPAPPAPAPVQIAAPSSTPEPSTPPPTTSSAETHAASPPTADEAAWQAAFAANAVTAFNEYLKVSPTGAHAEEAQMRIAGLILDSPIKSNAYDGKWLTSITCPSFGRAQAYAQELTGDVKDGAYHGHVGAAGEAGSLVVDGKITSEGAVALLAKGFVGSRAASGGRPLGTPYFFHAIGRLQGSSGIGRRIEVRPCSLTFARQ
jgi:TIR domain